MRIERFALRPLDAILAGPFPEALARSLVEHRVVERFVSEFLEAANPGATDAEQIEQLVDRMRKSPAVKQWIADGDAARLAEELADQVVRSAAFKQAMREALASREFREAVSRQTAGFGEEAAAAARTRADRIDEAAEATVRRWLGRPRREPVRPRFAGLGTRGVALVVDAALAQVTFIVAAASIALVVALADVLRPGWLAGTLAAAGWLLVSALYFVAFWSSTGQTPGMHLMRLRVVTGSDTPPSVPRSILRFAGLIVAIAPLFAGFLPALVDGRRRALQDFLAGTVVVYDRPSAGIP